MLRNSSRIVSIIALALLSMVIGTSEGAASQFSFGEVSMRFLDWPQPDAPWHLGIRAVSYHAFDDGKVAVARRRPGPGPSDIHEDIVWTGRCEGSRDTLVVDFDYPPPEPGLYMLAASINPSPHGGEPNVPATFDIWYILVRADTVLISQSDYGDVLRQELDVEIRQRGLEEVDPKLLDSLAPDLAERWRGVHRRKGITTIRTSGPKATPAPENRLSTGEGRDTTLIPGWGPPPYKPTPDSVKARFFHRGANPRLEPPPPPFVKPEDTEFGRSEEAKGLRALFEPTAVSIPVADSALATPRQAENQVDPGILAAYIRIIVVALGIA